MIETLELILEIGYSCWMLFFIVFGWVSSFIPVFIFGWSITISELYWIGIISLPIFMGIITILTYYLEKDEKKKYKDLIPKIDEINNKVADSK